MKKIFIFLWVLVLTHITSVSANYTYSCEEKEISNFEYNYENSELKLTDTNNNTNSIYYNKDRFSSFNPYEISDEFKNIVSFDYMKNKLIYSGKEVNTYNLFWGWEDTPTQVYLSSNKKSFSFKTSGDNWYFVIKDWKKQQSYSSFPWTTFIAYSPKKDSDFIIYYWINKGDKYIINLDGIELLNYKYDTGLWLWFFNNWDSIYSINSKDWKNYLLTCNISKKIESKFIQDTQPTITKNTNNSNIVINVPFETEWYILTDKEKVAVQKIANQIVEMDLKKRTYYINKLNLILTKLEVWSRKYQIAYQLLDKINNFESIRWLLESVSN